MKRLSVLLMSILLLSACGGVKAETPPFEVIESDLSASELAHDLLAEAERYQDYLLADSDMTLQMNKDGDFSFYSLSGGERPFSVASHHFHVSKDDSTVDGRYDKLADAELLDNREGGFFQNSDGEVAFFEYGEPDDMPLQVASMEEEAEDLAALLDEADFRTAPVDEAELAALGLDLAEINVFSEKELPLALEELTFDLGQVRSVQLTYAYMMDGAEYILDLAIMAGEQEFGKAYRKIKGQSDTIYAMEQLEMPSYYWERDGYIYSVRSDGFANRLSDEEIVGLVAAVSEALFQ